MTEQYDAAGKTGYRLSADVYSWIGVDMDSISVNAYAKISASAHLCK